MGRVVGLENKVLPVFFNAPEGITMLWRTCFRNVTFLFNKLNKTDSEVRRKVFGTVKRNRGILDGRTIDMGTEIWVNFCKEAARFDCECML
jgi:hypothetical protein